MGRDVQIKIRSWSNTHGSATRALLLLLVIIGFVSLLLDQAAVVRDSLLEPSDNIVVPWESKPKGCVLDNVAALSESKLSGREVVDEDWGCSSLPEDLRQVLEPHCIVQGSDLPLSTLLPNLNLFRRFVRRFDSHARAKVWRLRRQIVEENKNNENTKQQILKAKAARLVDYVLVAGRGTTGTSSIYKWLG
eukprot:128904_1